MLNNRKELNKLKDISNKKISFRIRLKNVNYKKNKK